jgi:hypothetical protein
MQGPIKYMAKSVKHASDSSDGNGPATRSDQASRVVRHDVHGPFQARRLEGAADDDAQQKDHDIIRQNGREENATHTGNAKANAATCRADSTAR